MRCDHPRVGVITLTRDNLAVDGRDGLGLMIYHAGLRRDGLDKLAQLSDMAVPGPSDDTGMV